MIEENDHGAYIEWVAASWEPEPVTLRWWKASGAFMASWGTRPFAVIEPMAESPAEAQDRACQFFGVQSIA